MIDDNETVKWDISKNKENATLLDRGLYDYKTDSFVTDHLDLNGIIDYNKLNESEKNFVNMVGCYWKEGNDYATKEDYSKTRLWSSYNYELVDHMIESLNNGQILDVYMALRSGGHVVNVYDYHYDKNNPDIVHFDVYDNNFPQNRTNNGSELVGNKCQLTIQKLKRAFKDEYIFNYEYAPIKGNWLYKSTSSVLPGQRYTFIVMDHNWNVYNDLYDN